MNKKIKLTSHILKLKLFKIKHKIPKNTLQILINKKIYSKFKIILLKFYLMIKKWRILRVENIYSSNIAIILKYLRKIESISK